MPAVSVRSVLSNAGLTTSFRVGALVLSVATVPAVLARVGMSGYGGWEATLAVANLGQVFVTALYSTQIWRLSDLLGRGERAHARSVAQMGVLASIVVALTGMVVAFFTAPSIVAGLKISSQFAPALRMALPTCTFMVLIQGASECQASLVSAVHRSGLVSMALFGSTVANYIVCLTGLAMGFGLSSLPAGMVVGGVVYAATVTWMAHKHVGFAALVPRFGPKAEWAILGKYMGQIIVGRVAVVLKGQVDRIVLSSFASPAWVGWYAIAARLAALVAEVSTYVTVPIVTAAGHLKGTDDLDQFESLLQTVARSVGLVVALLVAVLLGCERWLQIAWVGHYNPEVTYLLWILMVASVSQSLVDPLAAAYKGLGKIWMEAVTVGISAALNALLTVVLVTAIGATGTVWATAVAAVASSLLYILLAARQKDLRIGFLRNTAMAVGVATVLGVGLSIVAARFPLPGRSLAALAAVGSGCVLGVVLWSVLSALQLAPSANSLLATFRRK